MRMRYGMWLLAFGLALIASPVGAQQANQGPSIEQRVGYEIGPIVVRAAALSAQVEQLQAIVAQRDKTIAELQAQIAELKKDAPK